MNQTSTPHGTIHHGDCIDIMAAMPKASADFILTDPPYIVRYKDRSGRSIFNDAGAAWLKPSAAQMFRVLKPDSFCISFYGWNKVDLFMAAWKEAGFRVCGHIVFRKRYASNGHFLQYKHESAYLLTKGNPAAPERAPPDVMDWEYSGNKRHPTEKAVSILKPWVEAFSKPGDTVLDPFCGSGSTLEAARELHRRYAGIELDAAHFTTASDRMANHQYGHIRPVFNI